MKQRRHVDRFVMLLVGVGLVAGCGDSAPRPASSSRAADVDSEQIELIEKVLDETVGQYAYLEGGAPLVVRGYGLVVGLAGNGSSEVPTAVRDRLIKEMGRRQIGDVTTGTQGLNPHRLIDDPDTAPVVVSAIIPPGTPAGTPIDVSVTSIPKSQTLSLDGGTLYRTDLQATSLASGSLKESRPIAMAKGSVFVNPFTDSADLEMTGRLRQGRVIGGGVTIEARSIRLVLRSPDYRVARNLQEIINAQYPGFRKVATAKNPSSIEIRIPEEWRKDYQTFLSRLMHLHTRRDSGAVERKAKDLAEYITRAGAPYEDISLVWETMGKTVIPVVRGLYDNEDPVIAFYAARAGLRARDSAAVEVMANLAKGSSPYCMQAVTELGASGNLDAIEPLTELLDDPDAMVRIAAYEAMVAGRLAGGIAQYDVDGQFELHIVPSNSEYMVYATRTGVPRLVLFGDGMRMNRPVFFNSPGDLVTINANSPDANLSVYRRVGARKVLSNTIETTPDIKSLILALGREAKVGEDGQFQGLGLTYSQVVGVVYRLCEDKAGKKVPAVFVLQKPDAIDRIGPGRSPVGREDSAGGR